MKSEKYILLKVFKDKTDVMDISHDQDALKKEMIGMIRSDVENMWFEYEWFLKVVRGFNWPEDRMSEIMRYVDADKEVFLEKPLEAIRVYEDGGMKKNILHANTSRGYVIYAVCVFSALLRKKYGEEIDAFKRDTVWDKMNMEKDFPDERPDEISASIQDCENIINMIDEEDGKL